MYNFTQNIFFANLQAQIYYLIIFLKALVNIFFASAVAKDAGELNKRHRKTILVSAIVWVLATLVGGIFVAAIYWFMHHWPRNKSYFENKIHE